jgi:hypothetical protein
MIVKLTNTDLILPKHEIIKMKNKMNRLPMIILAGFILIAPTTCNNPASRKSPADDWVSLFNGQNLDGWSVRCAPKDKGNNFWTVDNGAILCNSLGSVDHNYIWLVSDTEFDNFELRLKFQVSRRQTGNSGIQVRSRWDPRAEEEGTGDLAGWLDGPQIDIEPNDPWRNGYIYDETREAKHWIHPILPDWQIDSAAYAPEKYVFYFEDQEPGWNDVRIICDGLKIKTVINNITISDYDGSGVLDDAAHRKHNVGLKGHIAFQLHKYSENEIRFKDIEIRENLSLHR